MEQTRTYKQYYIFFPVTDPRFRRHRALTQGLVYYFGHFSRKLQEIEKKLDRKLGEKTRIPSVPLRSANVCFSLSYRPVSGINV